MSPRAEELYDDWEYDAEWPDQYGSGLFCPIYLGDRLKDRYIVFRKLGHGSQSTVWLAKDEQTSTCVALKIQSAEVKEKQPDLPMTNHPGMSHVEMVIDRFVHESPNGWHLCLVLEPLGRNLYAVLDRAWDYSLDRPVEKLDKYDVHDWSWTLGRKICHQIILGLEYLHSQKVAHLDFHPGNIAFALAWDISGLSENELQEDVWYPRLPDNTPETGQEVYKGSDAWTVGMSKLLLAKDKTESNGSSEKFDEGAEAEVAKTKEDETDSDTDDSEDEWSKSEWDRKCQERQRIQAEGLARRQAEIDALPDGNPHANSSTSEWAAANFKRTASAQVTKFIKRLDGKPLKPSEVKYTLISSCLHDRLILDLVNKKNIPLRVVIIDLGFSCAFERCAERELEQNSNFRTPECVLQMTTTWKADIWSLGLIVWFCITDRLLIQWYGSPFKPRRSVISYLHDLIEKIGPIPEEMRRKWPEADEHTNNHGELLEPHRDIDGNALTPDDSSLGDLRIAAYRDRPKDMADADVERFIDLMKKILQWEAEKRPNTSEILAHPFFADT